MILRCKNVNFHGKKPKYFEWKRTGKGGSRLYCHDPLCAQDLKNRQSVNQHERNRIDYKTVHHLYRKKGKKVCISSFCWNTHNNRFGYCDTCREHLSSGIDPNFLNRGGMWRNGSPIL